MGATVGELGAVPAAAEHLDEQNARVHAAAQNVDVVALVVECGGLCGDDLEIGVDSTYITVVEDGLGFLCGGRRLALLVLFVGEDAECDEVVLDLLIGGEDGLAIAGGGAVVVGDGLLGETSAATTIEEGFTECGAERIDEAGRIEERGDGLALETY